MHPETKKLTEKKTRPI